MFVVIYEFDVKEGMEEQFTDAWLALTRGIYEFRGSFGSRLQIDKSGKFLGYAQWPDREAWAKDWSADTRLSSESKTMWSCLYSSKTIYEAEVVTDYLQTTKACTD